jgi:hypothetical protein
MSKNRKNQSAAIRFGPALKAGLLCLLIGGSGVGYVWQKHQIYQLGQQIKKRETRRKQLEEQNELLLKQVAELRTLGALMVQIKRLNLGLGPPSPAQVCRLEEPARQAPNTNLVREAQFAAQAGRSETMP